MNASYLENLAQFDDNLTISSFQKLEISYGFEGLSGYAAFTGPKQVHSNKIVSLEDFSAEGLPEADGVFTTQEGPSIGVVTADCLPILLVSKKKQLAMAVHAGWRGQVQGIVPCSMQIFLDHKVAPEDVFVAFGPSITGEAYEVGPELVDEFRQKSDLLTSSQLDLCLKKGRKDRWFFDIGLAAVFQMKNCGLPAQNLSVVRSCTFAHANEWHSYRREKKSVGRNISWVKL